MDTTHHFIQKQMIILNPYSTLYVNPIQNMIPVRNIDFIQVTHYIKNPSYTQKPNFFQNLGGIQNTNPTDNIILIQNQTFIPNPKPTQDANFTQNLKEHTTFKVEAAKSVTPS